MTIYALSTGPGISGLAVIRVSGKNTADVVKKLTKNKLPKARTATLVKFNKNGGKELIDEGIIIWFPAPNSYTGEDLAEFHVHGSRAVIKAMHLAISKIKNCRLAEPGEFTKRAFQNGRINLLKAESIADLISAETEIQYRYKFIWKRIYTSMLRILMKLESYSNLKITLKNMSMKTKINFI